MALHTGWWSHSSWTSYMADGFQETAFQEDKPPCGSTYQAFVFHLVKSSHMAKLSISVGGNYTKPWIPESVVL